MQILCVDFLKTVEFQKLAYKMTQSQEKILQIAKDAVFIADSHWSSVNPALLETLQNIQASQVFLMGDISQVLVGNLRSSKKSNASLLESLQALSQRTQVFWFEGNHDFALNALNMGQIVFIPRCQQPLRAQFGEKRVSLAHGDLFLDKKYELYIRVLNSCFGHKVLKFLDWLTFGNLYQLLERKILKKRIYAFDERRDCEEFCKKRVSSYMSFFKKTSQELPHIIIEGHFHLNKSMLIQEHTREILYICLPSFYISQSVFALQYPQNC